MSQSVTTSPASSESQLPGPQSRFLPSADIVAREIEGELIIVPLSAGIGDLEDELYSMNDTGREVWRLMDGAHTLDEIAAALAELFDAPQPDILADVQGLVGELLRRRMLVEAPADAATGG
jgi:hypothetical protein